MKIEDTNLKEIKEKMKAKLKNDEEYINICNRKEEIINELQQLYNSNEKKELWNEYVNIGDLIKEEEIKKAYILTNSITNEKKGFFEKIINKISKKKKTIKNYDEEFNTIIKEEAYKKNLKARKEIFKKLSSDKVKVNNLLYELESIDIQIATKETDKVKENTLKSRKA